MGSSHSTFGCSHPSYRTAQLYSFLVTWNSSFCTASVASSGDKRKCYHGFQLSQFNISIFGSASPFLGSALHELICQHQHDRVSRFCTDSVLLSEVAIEEVPYQHLLFMRHLEDFSS